MELIVKKFDELKPRELYEILKARAEIFVVEQECAYLDIDGMDYESTHVFFKSESGKVEAYLRLFVKDETENVVQMGRVLTLEHGKGLGGKLLHEGVEIAKNRFYAKKIYIEAQTYAIGFYAREGFAVRSEEFLEDGIPHVKMELEF